MNPFRSGPPFDSRPPVSADRVFQKGTQEREKFWLQQIEKQDFKNALMIRGQNHTLSFAFRLSAAPFNVKAVTYAPPLPRG
jgi:hypothetical protein